MYINVLQNLVCYVVLYVMLFVLIGSCFRQLFSTCCILVLAIIAFPN